MKNDIFGFDGTTQVGKQKKVSQFCNGTTLTEKQIACGSIKGKTEHYCKELKCTFYVKDGHDPIEVEKRFIEAYSKSF